MQYRTNVENKFEAKGDANPPTEFDLVQTVTREARRTDREIWRWGSSKPDARQSTVLATFTRRGLAQLIADGADWLSYTADDETC